MALLALAVAWPSGRAVTCKVTRWSPSEAEQAFLHSDYDRAVTLYQTALKEKPGDPSLTAGLARVFLRQQKLEDAGDLVKQALAQQPQSVPLMVALGEVQYRAGTPWLAAATVLDAIKLDPCDAQARLLDARVLRLNSLYASAAKEVRTAHALEPANPSIRRQWLQTLPIAQRITELESYLATGSGDDPEDLRSEHFYLDFLKEEMANPQKPCRLVSNIQTATIPFAPLMKDAQHIRAFGLDVKVNERTARLQIDTGASGLLISRSVANHAGLKPFSRGEVGGIGSEGRKGSYVAYADDIKIGALEFQNCEVRVIDQSNVIDTDGLIGMNVFSRFLITLDYPMRKMLLAPLPPRLDDSSTAKPSLETGAAQDAEQPSPEHTEKPEEPAKAASRGPHDRYIAPEMKDWTRVYHSGHLLLIPGTLDRGPQKVFALDTGSFATTVSPEAARTVTKVHSQDNLVVHGLSGKVDKVYVADTITFQFANVEQRVDQVVAFSTANLSKNVNMEIAALIGITALGQMTIGIDYRDGLMKFSYDPNRGYKYPK